MSNPLSTVHMEVSKLTKGAVQYKEPGPTGPGGHGNPMYLIGTLYLRKAGMEHEQLAEQKNGAVEYPAHIKVTIEVVE